MFDHEFFVAMSKSLGMFFLMAIFFGAVVYACWPSNQKKFDRAANDILKKDED